MERARIASLQEMNYRQMEIQEMYGRRDGASTSHQPQQLVVPSRGGCGPSFLRSTSSRLWCSFSSRPSSYSQPSTTHRHEPIDVPPMTDKPSGLNELSFNSTSSDFYPQMVSATPKAGLGVRGPTAKELAVPCLEAVVHDVDKHIAKFKVC
ncbi:hypothetical protein AMTR_s00137p00076120 [Amborella trichopoda]|uniref:Uncharacterized protein n=1 Tax=Amborella trichopoda TaxID=13333 RepID=W1NER6_AMBTC|nr:hypothetical protein AMTR_s00137p00076120 [Amborella trichopoda]